MAAAWVKSLQCKSRAFDDVVHQPTPKQPLIPSSTTTSAAATAGNIASCRNSFQGLKDVIPAVKSQQPNRRPLTAATKSSSSKSQTNNPKNHHYHLNPSPKHKPKPDPSQKPVKRRPQSAPQPPQIRRQHHSSQSISKQTTASIHPVDPYFPSLSELQDGHPSRNVVEIIFQTRWGPKPFPGHVEMVFKIHNLPKTVTRFEDYRETVKTRATAAAADSDHADQVNVRDKDNSCCSEESVVRCVADGNEMMRFHCLGPTTGVIDAGAGGICAINAAGKGNNDKAAGGLSICTFDGSGTAHHSAGGGKGRRAMLVCRVIAGRVRKRRPTTATVVVPGGFESVAGDNGELLVFDSRAVLPCFLVIYRL